MNLFESYLILNIMNVKYYVMNIKYILLNIFN